MELLYLMYNGIISGFYPNSDVPGARNLKIMPWSAKLGWHLLGLSNSLVASHRIILLMGALQV